MLLVEGIFKFQNARKLRTTTLLEILPQKTNHLRVLVKLMYQAVAIIHFEKRTFFVFFLPHFGRISMHRPY